MSWTYHITNRLGTMTQQEMEGNVDEIYAQLYSNYTWSVNAICAVLGNLQQESALNPAQTQTGYDINGMRGGYGLAQWTPARKIKNWLQANNHSLYSGYWQIYALNMNEISSDYGNEYIPTTDFPLTFAEFKNSGETVAYLTEAFLKNYERAGDEALSNRIQYAEDWYRYIMGADPPTEPSTDPPQPVDPPDPIDPDATGYKGVFKTILFLRNRRAYPR